MDVAPEETVRSDASVLIVLGVTFFLIGLGLLLGGYWGLTRLLPPTLNTVVGALFGLGFGFAFLVTGFMYTVVARSSEELEVGEKGVSVTRDPLTGEREWIRAEVIEAATVRRWLMSPWLKGPRYAEVELKVKEGDLTVDDRFYVHLGREPAPVLERLRECLGPKVEVALGS